MVWLGLDGGGSTLRALAVADGSPVFRGQSGAANLASTPDDVLERHLAKALDGCPDPDAVFGAFAGAIDPETCARAERWLSARFPRARIRVGPDAHAALRACPTGTEIVVIAGTGSIVCSEIQGVLVRSGGRGYLLGDEGSGFRYGVRAVRLFLDDPTGPLAEAIAETYGSADPASVVAKVYAAPSPPARLAKLAVALGRVARAGNPAANAEIAEESALLAAIVRRHAETYATAPRVGLAGGLWKPPFVEAFKAALGPGYSVAVSHTPAVEGAAILAREMLA